ncbi:MAG: DcrB-related protein [Microthrixaceae bacterium]
MNEPAVFSARFRVPLPAGWFAKESVTILAPDGQANVIVSSEPLDPIVDTEEYVSTQGELLSREFSGFTQYYLEPRTVFGLPGYLRGFAWTPPDGVEIYQVQAYASVSGRGFTATATTPANNAQRFQDDFLAVLDHIELAG